MPSGLGFDAVLFDLDGVVTGTARLHAAAWAELFDDFLRRRAAEGGKPFRPFDPTADYLAYVDGKPRYEGVRSFLAARGIVLPEGDATDGPDAPTVHGLGRRKDALFMADVLMLFHLFPDLFPPEVVAANCRYYEPITDHGSSLSPGIHAAVAARLGLREDAERYWRESLWLDLSDVMSNSALGVHVACMGATWQALVFGLLGVRFTDAGPVADPEAGERLPAKWRAVSLALTWRDRVHRIEVAREAPR